MEKGKRGGSLSREGELQLWRAAVYLRTTKISAILGQKVMSGEIALPYEC
jgi:hypothetical protein